MSTRGRFRSSAFLAPLLPISGVALLAVVAIGLLRGESRAPEVTVNPPSEAQSYLRDVRIVSFDTQGQAEYRARADTAQYFDNGDITLDGVAVDYLGGANGPWVADAPQGRLPHHTRIITLNSGVTVRGQGKNPVSFDSDEVQIDMAQRRIRTLAPTTVRAGPQRVTAQRVETGFDAETLEFEGRVRTVLNPGGQS